MKIVTERGKKFEEMDSNIEELHEEMQEALNLVTDSCSKKVMESCDQLGHKLATLVLENNALREKVGSMKEDIRGLKNEMVVIMRALAQGNVAITPSP